MGLLNESALVVANPRPDDKIDVFQKQGEV